MTKSGKIVVISISLLIVLAVLSVFGYREYRKRTGVYVETVRQGDDGWGYKIYVKGKLVVNQYVMPAIAGQKTFPCEEAARKTAELVVEKVGHGEMPTVTSNEVNKILKDNCK